MNEWMNRIVTFVNKPRQGGVWQSCVSLSGPLQSDPLLRGGGLMQAWVRTCVPRPHVTEQSDHTDHGVQPPSTGNNTQDLLIRQFQGNITGPMKMCIFSVYSHSLKVSWCSSTHPFNSTTFMPPQLIFFFQTNAVTHLCNQCLGSNVPQGCMC